MRISIIIPAYNEEKRIGNTLEEYGRFFKEKEKQSREFKFEIIVVINNTTDNTEEIVKKYSKIYKQIRYLKFEQGGKGFAIIEGFKDSLKRDNDLIGFVDADMATSHSDFYDLIKNIGAYEGIIGSRWMRGSRVKRTLKKRIVSGVFNFIVRSLFLFPYRDTQCGAKIFKRRAVEKILPEMGVTEWAFDIEVLYLLKKKGFRIKEFPTVWEDKEGSNILSIPKTSLQMFLGVVRLRLINSPFAKILKPVKFILPLADRIINR